MLITIDTGRLVGLAFLILIAVALALLLVAVRIKCAVVGHDVQPWGICNRCGKRNLAP